MALTRRGLAKLAAAGVGLWCSGGAAAAEKSPGKAPAGKTAAPRVILGVQSYSFRDRSLDDAIKAMTELGIGTCELWQGHIEPRRAARDELRKWRLETPLSEFEAIAAKFKQANIDLCAYMYSFKDDFTEAEIERGFAMAKALGVKIVNASANQTTVARIAPVAKERKIKVGLHNHSKIDPNEFATPDDFVKAITGKGREWMAINLDIGHFTAANFDPVAFLEKHHARIVTLHIKDRKRDQGEGTAFGEGDTPIDKVLQLLRDRRWRIPANIEYEYKGGDSVVEVKRSLEYCQRFIT